MTTVSCLALIIYMEARGESLQTQQMVAKVAIQRASFEGLSICKSMKKPKSYSWMWDGVNTIVDKKLLKDKIYPVAKSALELEKLGGRIYFNNCELGKRYKTKYKVIKKGKLCFY